MIDERIMAKNAVLFVETGNQGGGSFGSLCQHLAGINRDKFDPIVAFVVPNKYTARLDQLRVPWHVVPDWYYPEDFTKPRKSRMLKWRRWAFRDHPRWTVALTRYQHAPLIRGLGELIKRHDIRLIHLNNTVYRCFFGLLLAKRFGLPCVSHLRSTNSGDFNRVMLAWSNRYVDQHIAVSSDTARHWINLGLPADKVVTIYNGIEPVEVVHRDLRSEFAIEPRYRHVIGVVAMLLGFKGHRFLFESFAKVAARRGDVILLVVGDGPIRPQLEQQVAAMGLGGRIRFLGHQDRAVEIIAALDLMIVSSQSEPLGRVILEAMSVRTPVIATDTGGSPEMIDSGRSGLLVPYDQPEVMAASIEALLDSPDRRTAMADEAFKIVTERFSQAGHVRQIEAIYDRLLGGRS